MLFYKHTTASLFVNCISVNYFGLSAITNFKRMNYVIEQKVKCCAQAISFGNEYEAITCFQRTYPNVNPPSRASIIIKWKTVLLETE